jgi:hypothetical protein
MPDHMSSDRYSSSADQASHTKPSPLAVGPQGNAQELQV